jgi:hypothetical protein
VRAWVTLLVLLAAVRPAAAEDAPPADLAAEARRHTAAGTQLATERRFDDALAEFKRARALVPDAATDCLIALTYTRVERWTQAQLFLSFSRVSAGTRPSWCGVELERSIAAGLRAQGCRPVDVMVAPADARVAVSSFAADEVVPGSWRIWLPAGRHTLALSRPGYVARSVDLLVEEGMAPRITVSLSPVRVAAETVVPAPPAPPAPPSADVKRGRSAWPWVVLATGLAAATVGVTFHVLAANSREAAAALPDGPAFDVRRDEFERRRAGAIAGYAVGAVGLVVGTVLLVRSRRAARPSGPSVALASSGEGVFGGVRWTLR